MAIITISRGSYSKGKEVAEKVAQRLGYDCISREVLVEASDHFNIPEIKLVRALHDAPSVLERFTYGKERYLAFFESSFLEYIRKDNVVYHGLAGHFYLKGVSHVLKVRILADLDDRIQWEMEREKITADEARYVLKKDDEERRRWSLRLFGADTWDPSLYDLVIHIRKITVDQAVDIICHTVQQEHFRATAESQQRLEDLIVAAKVKSRLIDTCPGVKVTASQGHAYVDTEAGGAVAKELADELKQLAEKVPEVKEVHINITPSAAFFTD
jgi:cytidylate kinase